MVLALAACGDDDGGAGEATVPSPATIAPAQTPATTASAPTAPAPTASAPTASAPTTNASSIPATTGSPAPPTTATSAPRSSPATSTPPGDPAVTLTEVAAVPAPVDLAWRQGDPALYVVEQDGRISRLADGEPQVVLDITDLTSASGEQGLLGLAFAPAVDAAYVNYTDNNGDTVIAEYPVDADGTFRAGDEARTVLHIDQPYGNHNGGDLTFGPDGMLYIGMGDGGAAGDPQRRATDPASLLGKMLRIDPAIGDGQPYTVPPDNPWVGVDGAAPEVWAYGLRNPWRFSFDRQTGDLWIADVGQNSFEEVDVAPATDGRDAGRGMYFGWSAFEGTAPFNSDVTTEGHTPPIFTYDHGQGCSISGGVRVRGGGVPALEGWYVFADYCANTVWALEVRGEGADIPAGRRVTLATNVPNPTAVVDGPDGATYVLSAAGQVLRLDPA